MAQGHLVTIELLDGRERAPQGGAHFCPDERLQIETVLTPVGEQLVQRTAKKLRQCERRDERIAHLDASDHLHVARGSPIATQPRHIHTQIVDEDKGPPTTKFECHVARRAARARRQMHDERDEATRRCRRGARSRQGARWVQRVPPLHYVHGMLQHAGLAIHRVVLD